MSPSFQKFSQKKNSLPKSATSGIFGFVVQFLIVAVAFFAIGFVVGQKKISIERKGVAPNVVFENQTPPQNQNVDFSLFWRVWDVLPQRYLDKNQIDGQKLLYGSISGMVRSLGDPYTAFLDPKQNTAVTDELSGSYQGIGIQIGFNKDKRLVVIAPLKGTPAEAAGLKPKDIIVKIDSKDTFDMTLPEAVDLIRGQVGSRVKLVLLHDGGEKTFEKDLARAQIDVKSVDLTFKDTKSGKIAIIKVSRFGEKTDSEWDTAVDKVLSNNVSGVVVDMRNNPGGLLTSAIHLASDFVKSTVVKQESDKGEVSSLGVDHAARLGSVPLVVLVNGGSASAAEIFAGAMSDNNRGKVVGEKSFGKGTVQDVVNFPGGSSLHVTIAKWLTPDGDSIHGVGITPDVVVVNKDDSKEDAQFDKALSLL